MKNLNSIELANPIKKNKKLLIFSLIFLVSIIALIVLGIKNENKKLPKAINMNDLVTNLENKENIHAYIDVNTKPYLFAVYETDGIEDDNKFYLVMDYNNYLYILYMSSSNFRKLNIDSISENPIRVSGLTKKIENDIKELAIDAYNEEMGSEYLTKENFKEYVGLIYLDLEEDINDSSLYYIGAFISFLVFLVLIIIYLTFSLKNRKTFKKYSKEELEKIGMEMYQVKENNPYYKMNFYLLKDYVVDTSNGIIVLKYEDIIWAYPYEYRYNGLVVNKNIKLYDKENKVYDVANTKYFDKNKEEILQEILKKLKEKNEGIILGFNKENKKIVKEKVKKQK